jgi:hypothetical protein
MKKETATATDTAFKIVTYLKTLRNINCARQIRPPEEDMCEGTLIKGNTYLGNQRQDTQPIIAIQYISQHAHTKRELC